MNIIEPHIHMYSRTTDDYQRMHAAGIRFALNRHFGLVKAAVMQDHFGITGI